MPTNLASVFPHLTHLHVWNVQGFDRLDVPKEMVGLDLRGCPQLEEVHSENAPIGQELLVLSLQDCPVLSSLRVDLSGQDNETAPLFHCSLTNCPALKIAWIGSLIRHASELQFLRLSGLPQLQQLPTLPATLQSLRVAACQQLQRLPRQWPQSIVRIEFKDCDLVTAIPRLPESIDYLDLCGSNNIDALPIGWEGVRTLFLFDSGVLEPPAVVHGENRNDNAADRCRQYFDQRRQYGDGVVKRCRLLMLGNGGAGKTTLSLTLTGRDPGKAEILGSTHGVQFWPHQYGSGAEGTSLQVWDFGGQEIYHNTHRLFFSGG
ncbi:MAG: hypothetical protein AAFN70_19725, partial [Planctomycetota bacterium]